MTTTSDARKRLAENAAARTASTPGAVAVPEGGWRDGDQVAVLHGPHLRVLDRRSFGWVWSDGQIVRGQDAAIEELPVVYVHAPRPEPVVAPLPSEAVRALRAAADEMEAVIADGDSAEACAPVPGEVGRSTVVGRRDALYEEPHTWLREYADRLVPEDDQGRPCLCGTPGGADCWCPVHGGALARETSLAYHVKRLNALLMKDDEDTVRVPRVALIELNAAVMERKRDLVDAIEEFNDEVRA